MKYGFVYIWYDKKRTMFYIGSHWGTEDDGYICSSNRMRDAYRRRPGDFKRRILSKVYSNRNELLELEELWLQKIPVELIGKRYYNLQRITKVHWTLCENNLSIREKMSKNHRSKRGFAPPRLGKPRKHNVSENSTTRLSGSDRTEAQKAADIKRRQIRGKGSYPKEHGEKISAARKGIVFSEKHKRKLSEARKGKVPWNKGLKFGDHKI